MLKIEFAVGDPEVNVGMLIELSAVGVQRAEDADFNAHLSREA